MHRLVVLLLFVATASIAAPATACKYVVARSLFAAPPTDMPEGAVVLHGRLVREGAAVESYRGQAWRDPTSASAFIGFLTPDDAPSASVALYAGVSTCHTDTQSYGGPEVDVYVFGTYAGGEDGTPVRFEAFSEWHQQVDLSGIDLSRFAEYETP